MIDRQRLPIRRRAATVDVEVDNHSFLDRAKD